MKSTTLSRLILKWVGTALAVYLAAWLINGIRIADFWTALLVSLILGLLNVFIKPFLQLISLPLIVLTLGIFLIVINAVLLLFTGDLVSGFYVDGFWPAFWGALIVSVVSYLLDPPRKDGNNRGGGSFTVRIDRNDQ